MKKLIFRLVIALVVVIILAVLAAGLFLDTAIKRGVETFGPRLTKVDIKLQSVNLSVVSGSGSIKGLVVGNPEGFKAPSAISVGAASFALKPSSLLSDKVIIKSIKIEGPEVTYETDLRNDNLSKLLSNVREATGGTQREPAKPQEPAQPGEAKPAKKLQVDEFIITKGVVHVRLTAALIEGALTVPLPEIHFQDLGAGPDGITPGELTKKVVQAIKEGAIKAGSDALADMKKGAVPGVKDLGGSGSNAVRQVTEGILNPFKKK